MLFPSAFVRIIQVLLHKEISADPAFLQLVQSLGCNDGPTPVTTAWVPTDGSCFGISPIISGNTDSGMILQQNLATLPTGCKRKDLSSLTVQYLLILAVVAYFDTDCSSANFIDYTATGRCGTFGPGKLIRSAKTVGTCA